MIRMAPKITSWQDRILYLSLGLALGAVGIGVAVSTELKWEDDLSVVGDVGIGTGAIPPIEKLALAGVLSVRAGLSDPDSDSLFVKLYSKGFMTAEMWAMDSDDNTTQLTTHADPRDYGAAESTSFEDPQVELPFSFHHKNRLVGKGAVVDLAAVVRDLESLTGKSYTTVYDLPAPSTEELLDRYEGIEVPIEEAWEQVEVMVPETETVYRYDLETEEVSQVEVPTGEPSEVGTGIFRRELKENVRFDEETGKFFRRPTLAEIPQGATPNLPLWIAERLPSLE